MLQGRDLLRRRRWELILVPERLKLCNVGSEEVCELSPQIRNLLEHLEADKMALAPGLGRLVSVFARNLEQLHGV